MSAARDRVTGVVSRLGEDFTVGGSARRGVFSPMARGVAASFLSQTVLNDASLPVVGVLVAHDDATETDDTVVWNGLSKPVRNVVEARLRGEVVAKLLVLG